MRVVYAFLPTAALAFVGHKVSLPRAAPRQAVDSFDVSSLDPTAIGGVVAVVGAAAVLAGKGGDGAAGSAPAAAKATAAKVTNAVWSGDAFRAATWPAGPARSFSSSPPAAVQGPSAEELATAAAASSSADGPCTAAGGDDEKDRAGPAGQVAARKASPLHTAFVTFAVVALAAAGAPPDAPSPPLPARTAAAPTAATTPPSTVGSRLEMSKLEMSAACRGAARGSDTLCPTSASAAVGRKTTLIV